MSRRYFNTWFAWAILSLPAMAGQGDTWGWISRAVRERLEAQITGYHTTETFTANCSTGTLVWVTNLVEAATGVELDGPVDLIKDLNSTNLVIVGYQTNTWTNVTVSGTGAVTNVTVEMVPLYDLDYFKTTNVIYSVGGTSCTLQVVNGRYVTNHAPRTSSRYLDYDVVRWLARKAVELIPRFVDMDAVRAGYMTTEDTNAAVWVFLNYTNLLGARFYGWSQIQTNYPESFPMLTVSQVWDRAAIGTSFVYLTVTDRGTNWPKTVTNNVDGWRVGQLNMQTVEMITTDPRYLVATNRQYHFTGLAATNYRVNLVRMTTRPELDHVGHTGRFLTAFGFVPDDLNGRWTRGTGGWERAGYRIAPATNGLNGFGWDGWQEWLADPTLDFVFQNWLIYKGSNIVFTVPDYLGYPRSCVVATTNTMTGGVFVVSSELVESQVRDVLGFADEASGPGCDPDAFTTVVRLAGVSNWNESCGITSVVIRSGESIEPISVIIKAKERKRGASGQWLSVITTNTLEFSMLGEQTITGKLYEVLSISSTVSRVALGNLELTVEARTRDGIYGSWMGVGRIYEERLMSELVNILTCLTHTARSVSFRSIRTGTTNQLIDSDTYDVTTDLPSWPALGPAQSATSEALSFSASYFQSGYNWQYSYQMTRNGSADNADAYILSGNRKSFDLHRESGQAGGMFARNLTANARLFIRLDDTETGYKRATLVQDYVSGAIFTGGNCEPTVEKYGGQLIIDNVYPVNGAFSSVVAGRYYEAGEFNKSSGNALLVGSEIDPVGYVDMSYGLVTYDLADREVWSGQGLCGADVLAWDVSNIRRYNYANHYALPAGRLRGTWLMRWEFEPRPVY